MKHIYLYCLIVLSTIALSYGYETTRLQPNSIQTNQFRTDNITTSKQTSNFFSYPKDDVVPTSKLSTTSPEIMVTPQEFTETLKSGETVTRTLTVENTRSTGSDLSVELTINFGTINNLKNTNPLLIPSKTNSSGSIIDGYIKKGVKTDVLLPKTKPKSSGVSVLYVNTMNNGDQDFTSAMINLPNIGTFENFDARSATPNVDYLLSNDVVIVASNSGFANPNLLGDNLANYVDQGGRVVLLQGTLSTGGGWTMTGTIVTENYSPLSTASYSVSWNSSSNFTNHPITNLVNDISTGIYSYSNIQGSGISLGSYVTGHPLAAYNAEKPIVAINVFPSDGSWGGDFIQMMQNTIDWLMFYSSWLYFDVEEASVEGGQSHEFELTFNAEDLYEGTYEAIITVNSNDPNRPKVDVPVTLHVTGEPAIEISSEDLDFGYVKLSVENTMPLTITNTGTAELVISDIQTSGDNFYTNETEMSINPGHSKDLVVRFYSDELGVYEGELTFNNNIQGQGGVAIPLRAELVNYDLLLYASPEIGGTVNGEGKYQEGDMVTIMAEPAQGYKFVNWTNEANTEVSTNPTYTFTMPASQTSLTANFTNQIPEISVNPKSFEENLDSDDLVTRGLTVYNNGVKGSNLEISISIQTDVNKKTSNKNNVEINSTPSICDKKSKDPNNVNEKRVAYSGVYHTPLNTNNTSKFDLNNKSSNIFFDDFEGGIDNWYTEVYTSSEDLWHVSSLSSSSPSNSLWCGIQGQNHYNNGQRINTAIISPSISIPFSEEIYLDFWESFSTESGWDYCMVDISTDNGSTWNNLRGTASANTAPSGNSGGWVNTALDISEYQGETIRVRFYFDTKDGVANNYPGWFVDDVAIKATYSWLVINESEANILGGQSKDFELTFNSENLNDGTYEGLIRVSSNDLENPEVVIPVTLHVTGYPDISLSHGSLNFGNPRLSEEHTRVLTISNTGTSTLEIYEIQTQDQAYHANEVNLSLNPGQSYDLAVYFSSNTPGVTESTLTFSTNVQGQELFSIPLTANILVYDVDLIASPLEGGTVEGEGQYQPDDVVSISATQTQGYSFVNWTENGMVISGSPNYSFTATQNRTLEANFEAINYTLTLNVNDGLAGNVAKEPDQPHYNIGDVVTLTATTADGYLFSGWYKDGDVISVQDVLQYSMPAQNVEITAHFVGENDAVTISAMADPNDAGKVNGSTDYSQVFAENETVVLEAKANTGFTFINWTENDNEISTDETYTFNATQDRTLVANFNLRSYTISASVDPVNSGTVSGAGDYNYGETVTLTATTSNDYTFVNWTQNGIPVSSDETYTFTATKNRTLVANFNSGYTISASVNPENSGTVSGAGHYNYRETVSLTATANEGYTFVRWIENGTEVSTSETYSFTATSDRTLVAHFSIKTYTIIASVEPANSGTITGADTYEYGSTVSLTAEANEGYTFVNWTEDGTEVSENATYSFTATAPRTLVANFELSTGIISSALKNLKAHPNPFNESITLENTEGVSRVIITSIIGQRVMDVTLNGQSHIKTSHLTNGIYLLEFHSNTGDRVVKRMVKQ